MKKAILSVLAFNFSFTAFNAQVGINTTAPQSTLQINAKNSTGNSTNVDGILVPRVDRQRAQSMSSVPVSTLIYVNNISTGSQTGTAVNINKVGFYHFNTNNVWELLSTSNTEKASLFAQSTSSQNISGNGNPGTVATFTASDIILNTGDFVPSGDNFQVINTGLYSITGSITINANVTAGSSVGANAIVQSSTDGGNTWGNIAGNRTVYIYGNPTNNMLVIPPTKASLNSGTLIRLLVSNTPGTAWTNATIGAAVASPYTKILNITRY